MRMKVKENRIKQRKMTCGKFKILSLFILRHNKKNKQQGNLAICDIMRNSHFRCPKTSLSLATSVATKQTEMT